MYVTATARLPVSFYSLLRVVLFFCFFFEGLSVEKGVANVQNVQARQAGSYK